MLQNMLTRFFGNRNQRMLKKMQKTVEQITSFEAGLQALDDAALTAKTAEFRQRFADGETADAIMPEAFAVVREAAVRTLGMRHFDVQMIGGMVLNSGKIAEMRTGEGKTLMSTLPAYLQAVLGQPVHVVTVNDYLARRDAEWMAKVYEFLDLSVGIIYSGQDRDEKREAYRSDIVYGTNNEFGFDYLRDNMAFTSEDRGQRGLGFAIVDEVDSILIDEARTPLIISGPADESTDLYQKINMIVPQLVEQEKPPEGAEEGYEGPGDFSTDEKTKRVTLTEEGHEHAEQMLIEAGLLADDGNLYDVNNISLLHHLDAALRAHHLFKRNIDYIVDGDQVVIIDEFTGRMMAGRRWSDGLHQAVEAKEGVTVQPENQTLASITFQNYFRLYDRLSGMTGTADTEAPELLQIYSLEVVLIPTNKPMVRDDKADLVYRTHAEKFNAIAVAVREAQARHQPVLVGTASIESSEYLSQLLTKAEIKHEVLNAKQHEREAIIIAEAGRPGHVTIATNMAGRGTDIVLGGNLELELTEAQDDSQRAAIEADWRQRHDLVLASGGLHVLGTERNESRRVDNQLRGRSGRQGDPGSSQFYLSLEDSLMRIFGSERISGLMQKLGMEEGEAIEHPWVTRAIENAQKKVEGHNFDMRKQLLEYDDVANEQRKVIYQQRNELMDSDDVSTAILDMRGDVVKSVVHRYIPPQSLEEQWDVPGLENALKDEFAIEIPVQQWLDEDDSLHEETLIVRVSKAIDDMMEQKENRVGAESMRRVEKAVMLRLLDEQWKEHLAQMDHLRQSVALRGYAQKNPKQEYKRESFEMFSTMLESVKYDVTTTIARIQVPTEQELADMELMRRQQEMEYIHKNAENLTDQAVEPTSASAIADDEPQVAKAETFVRPGRKVGRNEACPCGSGKKYKQCHGKLS